MKRSQVADELHGQRLMDSIDPAFTFHLPPPISCEPADDPVSVLKIKNCARVSNNDDKQLLIIQDGGINLDTFYATPEFKTFINANPVANSILFWKSARTLLQGVELFQRHGIVHNDIKPANILFNVGTGTFAFIDFGLTTTIDIINDLTSKNRYQRARFYFAYPPECAWLNSVPYLETFVDPFPTIHTNIVQELKMQDPGVPSAFSTAIALHGTYTTTVEPIKREIVATATEFVADFEKWMRQICTDDMDEADLYPVFVSHVVRAVDIYGLGLTLKHSLNKFPLPNHIPREISARMSTLFGSMCTLLPTYRNTDIHAILAEYDAILADLTRVGGGQVKRRKRKQKHAPTKRQQHRIRHTRRSKYSNNI